MSSETKEGKEGGLSWAILQTQDGGRTWKEQRRGEDAILYSIDFLNENEGWAVGSDLILHTTDGGANWKVEQLSEGWLEGIYFLDARRGWIFGDRILYTTDGGVTWVQEPKRPFGRRNLNDVVFVTSKEGWVVGEGGAIFHTADGGLTWQMQKSPTSAELFGVHFINVQEGWVVGDKGVILHTTDRGRSWVKQRSGTVISLKDVQFLNAKEGWVVGGQTAPPGEILLHTVDGGRKWKPVRDAPIGGPLRDVHFVDQRTGWIVGLITLIHTADGGENWTKRRTPPITIPSSVYFLDGSTGWVADMDGIIAHTEDGGLSWEVQYQGKKARFETIYFANRHEGWAAGRLGSSLLHTSDGGQTWDVEGALGDISAQLKSICYGGKSVLWAVGEYGTLLRYHDPDLRVIPPPYWAVEPRGKSISPWGGIKQEGKRSTTSAPVLRNQLHQNYPNPFNLETWIPFQLAGESEVIIRIYDVQGRLVRELLLGRRGAGYYLDKRSAARWDGRDEMGVAVPSGVYFYTLTAKGYTATRKLVLIK